jgi:ATP synthase protein I
MGDPTLRCAAASAGRGFLEIAGACAMANGDPGDPLKALERRLEEARRTLGRRGVERGAANAPQLPASALGLAWRIGLELVVAIVVGTGIGWAIDTWLGTKPWGMIVMFFLGTAAGMLNVWRAVTGAGMAVGYRPQHDAQRRAGDEGKDED